MSARRLRWVVNGATHTLHDGWELDERCNVDDMRAPVKRVGTREMKALLLEGFELCAWCWPDQDEDD